MIRLIVLGHSSDDKGTQLETLTASILSSLKYTDIIMNVVGKGGNELDVVAKYSTPHISGDLIHPVVCECKAYKSKVDITDWLKFLGKFYTARLEDSKAMGIMIALSGANSLMSFEKYVFALIDSRSRISDSGSDGCGLLWIGSGTSIGSTFTIGTIS